MTEDEARTLSGKLKKFCDSNNLWYSITEEKKPELSMIKFNEISIKVTKKRSK